MANTFGILAALVLAFSAFVAYKNKEEFENQKGITDTEQTKKERNEKTYEGLVADVDLLNEEIETANSSKSELQAKLDTQNEANDKLQTEIADKERTLETLQAEVSDAEATLKETGDVATLAPKIDQLNGEIADLQDEVTTLNTTNDRLKGEKARTKEAELAAKEKLQRITSGRSLASMSTSVESVNRSLGFVTLANGIKSGVVGGSKVAVVRGGEKIAELSVTAASANAATADILFSTVKEGTNVLVGDKVVPLDNFAGAAN